MKSLVFALALLAALAPSSSGANAHFKPEDSWWECFHAFQIGEGKEALHGRLVRMADRTGANWSEGYEMWGDGIRIGWKLTETPGGTRRQVAELSVEVEPRFSRDGQRISGSVFGDDELVSTVTLLSPESAKKGYSTTPSAFFSGERLETRLAEHDRWRFVAKRSDGKVLVRKIIAVPDRRERDRMFVLHRAAIDAAWRDRDEHRLVSEPSDTLPSAPATCLFSPPDARAAIQDQAI